MNNNNRAAIEVWEWISNFNLQFTGHLIIYQSLKLIHFSKMQPSLIMAYYCMFIQFCIQSCTCAY